MNGSDLHVYLFKWLSKISKRNPLADRINVAPYFRVSERIDSKIVRPYISHVCIKICH